MPANDFPPVFTDALDQAVREREGRDEIGEVRFRCPAPDHLDAHPSARWNSEKATWTCDACGAGGGALDLADRLGIAKPSRSRNGGEGVHTPHNTPATVHTSRGCTLAQYAEAKRLPVDTLRAFGLSDISYLGSPTVRIPYPQRDGTIGPTQYRVRLTKGEHGDDRFKWKSGSKSILYGLDRFDVAREHGFVVIVEGASDSHTLWHHGVPAVGLPGAGNWKDDRDAAHLDGIETVYVVVEPDQGGAAVTKWLATSRIRERVRLVDLSQFDAKDASALHIADANRFRDRWQEAMDAAEAWTEHADAEAAAEVAEAWTSCQALAHEPDILGAAADLMAAAGVAGESRTLKLIFLILVSRFLPRPVSAAIKGPSSGGKSHLVERVLDLFPDSAYYALSAMSERALAYSEEPLAHRFLVLYEATGMAGDFASYLIRSLLSEGKVRYETVEKTKDGLQARLIERAGPTGLLVTTTAVHLHPENETRLLSIPVTDTPAQTSAIFRALANGTGPAPDLAPWHALQVWLGSAEHRVALPYADGLAVLVPPSAVRLRRDFGLLLNLIRAHAILHQATRERDTDGRITATVADCAAVRGLVADLIAEGVEATVPTTVRETVTVVRDLIAPAKEGASLGERVRDDPDRTASIAEVAKRLTLDRSAASRRVRVATDRGYLKNLEDKRGRPAKIALADPLPDDVAILPTPAALMEWCSRAGVSGGINTPPPPPVEPTLETAEDDDDDGVPARDPADETTGGRATLGRWGRAQAGTCLDCGKPLPPNRSYRCLDCTVHAEREIA